MVLFNIREAYICILSERASLLELCIERINITGAVVTNTVCDNPTVNISMLRNLGAIFSKSSPNPTLNLVNVLGKAILAYLDPPHCIKLTRNTFGDSGLLLDDNGEGI